MAGISFLVRFGAAGLLAFGLSGCVETAPEAAAEQKAAPVVPSKPPAPWPKETRANALNFQKAAFIADGCSKQFALSNAAGEMLLATAQAIEERVPEKPGNYTIRIVSEKEAQDDMLRYILARGIVLGKEETICAAGNAELSGKTAIGKYLVKK